MRSSKLRVLILVTLLTGLGVAGCHLLTDTEKVSKPVFSPPGGTYDSVVDVSITTATLGTTILYTTDGSDPNSNSLVYSGPIHVAQTTTLKAKAYRSGMQDSAIATANYTIELPPPPPIQMIHVPGGTIYPTTGIYTDGLTVPSFYIGKNELTNAEWNAVMGSGGGNDYPHSNVSWFGAIEYCNRRSLQEGLTPCYSYLDYGTNPDDWPSGWNTNSDNAVNVSCDWNAIGYRLPSEAEWEYAARGGLQTHGYTYSGSNDLNEVGWYYDNGGGSSHPVGQLAPNELGTYDMSGNLWEWVWDIYSGSYRVLRGGDFNAVAGYCTVSVRGGYYAAGSGNGIGFRICRVSP
ncbi:MAG: SUMF1/EgtB/PvdO family nonheme iron enzyme [Candidatus Cloacimonetes bacterium]|nr:SUMF1/EgtB/PvdO family nonheme iron enzyme [Candidatus Cloacimonadota bacterium]